MINYYDKLLYSVDVSSGELFSAIILLLIKLFLLSMHTQPATLRISFQTAF